MKNRSRIISAAMVAVTMAGGTALAANVTWTGGDLDGLYSNSNNWDTGTLPTSADNTYLQNGDTVSFADGLTNTIDRAWISGGTVINMTGGFWNHQKSGNTRRTFLGSGGTVGTVNQSGGMFRVGHALWITDGGDFNLTGGALEVYRGSNTGVGGGLPNGASISIGRDTTAGSLTISGGSVGTRGQVEIGAMGTFEIVGGYADSIDLGVQGFGNGDGGWYQTAGGTLKIGISTNGLTPIVLNDTGATGEPYAQLFEDSILDVSFIDGAMETNFWPVLNVSSGELVNAGMIFAEGVDTNDWGFITSNNTLWVGYGLGWPAGGDVVTPPPSSRTMYWTGAGGDTDANNGTNWVVDVAGTTTDWGIYNGDSWYIGNYLVPTDDYIVDYDGSSIFYNQGAFSVGDQANGVLNFNSGSHAFATTTSSRQYIGHGGPAGNGIVNLNEGTLQFNSLSVANNGASGAINVYGGTFTVGRASDISGFSASIALAENAATGTGTVHIAGGRMFTRTGVSLGAGGGTGIFSVEGSTITDIGIGSNSALDGAWIQYGNSILKIRVDAGGVTPITVVNKDAGLGGNDGNVLFYDGATLDIAWVPGVTNYNSFDVMTWDGELVESNLTLAASVDTSIWSFEFVDANSDGTNDTLRAEAYGETANGTPYGWLDSYGLTVDDDEVDNDNDGLMTYEEYVAGTIPTNSSSVLVVNSLTSPDGVNAVISWQSVAGKSYSIIVNDDLVTGTPTVVGDPIVGLETETSVTSSIPAASSLFYQIGVE